MSSETSEIRSQKPRNYPKRNKLYLENGESLKIRISHEICLLPDNADLRADLTVPDGELGALLGVVSEADKELVVSCVA